jgi:hypothetical protein
MHSPKIIHGTPFDWNTAAEAANNIANEDGSINYRAAFYADPGVTKCPNCYEYYWREGIIVQCLACKCMWDVRDAPDKMSILTESEVRDRICRLEQSDRRS